MAKLTDQDKKLIQLRLHGGTEIMKASAGSGKTFALVREYIRLALGGSFDRDAYRRILAVTFTNKATAEMKTRIVKELDILAHSPEKSDYHDYLLEACGIQDDGVLKKRSSLVLGALLNDYGSFSVSTIDSFFQKVLRSFAREADQTPDYRIVLSERAALVEEAADKALDSISRNDPDLLDWMVESSGALVSEGYGNKLSVKVHDFAEGLLSNKYLAAVREFDIDIEESLDPENIRDVLSACRQAVKDFDSRLKTSADEAVRVLETYEDRLGARAKSGLNKLRSVNYRKYIDIKENVLGSTLWDYVNKPDSVAWMKKLGPGAGPEIIAALQPVCELDGDEARMRNTAMEIRNQVHTFRLAGKIRKCYSELLKEKNILSIEDSSSLLKDIVGDAEAPFIYEKTGTAYDSFLLDEFQDTSVEQWENFLPLLRNNTAQGGYNLTVGDVKQSIYRWRNADWSIFNSRVASELDGTYPSELPDNWRSAKNIVRFNNALYPYASEELYRKLSSDDVPDTGKIKDIYISTCQGMPGISGTDGSVDITFCDDRKVQEQVLCGTVGAALARGFSQRDIAVLVRTRADGEKYARAIGDAGYSVISNDSLRLGYNPFIQQLVKGLYLFNDPSDTIHTYEAPSFDRGEISRARNLGETVRYMLRYLPEAEAQASTAYIIAFLDLVRDYESENGDSLDGFLQFWEETGRSQAVQCSPDSDAVTVITIHKAKGLEYPFVIIPFGKDELMRSQGVEAWVAPDTGGTVLDPSGRMLFKVNLTGSSKNTLFYDSYQKERLMSCIDILNTTYVATTRPTQAMHLICGKYNTSSVTGIQSVIGNFVNGGCADPEVRFEEMPPYVDGKNAKGDPLAVRYNFGGEPVKAVPKKKGDGASVEQIPLIYSATDGIAAKKLAAGWSSRDYFSEDRETYENSVRIRGTVLHAVMERIHVAADLDKSLATAVATGEMTGAEAGAAKPMLKKALAEGCGRGWFPEDRKKVLAERDLVVRKPDGTVETSRPDRVVMVDGHIEIIDYKFGKREEEHIDQVRRYAEIYRKLGYSDVRTFLWYLGAGRNRGVLEV